MKKYIFALFIMLYAGLNAQTFDFTCETIDNDFTHTASEGTLNGYIYNTAVVGSEIRMEEDARIASGTLVQSTVWAFEGGTIYLMLPTPEYAVGDGVVIKKEDVGENVYIGDLLAMLPGGVNIGGTTHRIFRVRQQQAGSPALNLGSHDGALEVGKITWTFIDNDYTHITGDVNLVYTTATTQEFRLDYADAISQAATWYVNTSAFWEVTLVMDTNRYSKGDFIIVKQQDITNVEDVWIGRVDRVTSANNGAIFFYDLEEIWTPDTWTLERDETIQVGKISENTKHNMNLRVEIAQPYPSDYSAVEQVRIRLDPDKMEIIMNNQIEINANGASHVFQESHTIKSFNESEEIFLYPRTDGINQQSVQKRFAWTPPTTFVSGGVVTCKFFARDGGYDIANTHLRSLDDYFELDPSRSIAGETGRVTGTTGSGSNARLIIGLDAATTISAGDRIIVSTGDLLSIGEVHSVTFTNTVSVIVDDGHSWSFHYDNAPLNDSSTKLYVLK